MSVIDQLRNRKQKAADDYRQLVIDLSEGREATPDRAEKIIGAAGKSLDELAADADRRRERLRLLAEAKRDTSIDDRRRAAEETARLAEIQVAAASARHEAAVAQLDIAAAAVAVENQRIGELRSRFSAMNDPVIEAKYNALESNRQALAQRRAQLDREAPQRDSAEHVRRRHVEEFAAVEAEISSIDRQLDAVRTELAEP